MTDSTDYEDSIGPNGREFQRLMLPGQHGKGNTVVETDSGFESKSDVLGDSQIKLTFNKTENSNETDDSRACACGPLLIETSDATEDELDKIDHHLKVLSLLDTAHLKVFSTLASDSEDEKPQLKRASSLKLTRRDERKERQKNVVRFADAFGLDLASFRFVGNCETPLIVPNLALADLEDGLLDRAAERTGLYLQPKFDQPCICGNFIERVLEQKIILENLMISYRTMIGVIRVRSDLGYHKTVKVRSSQNSWATFSENTCNYLSGSFDGQTEKFSFSLLPPPESAGSQLHFALCLEVGNSTFWDNNSDKNYAVQWQISFND